MRNKEIEVIGFMIQGDNIIVANPCVIPINLLEEKLKEKRNKDEISAVCMIKLPINFKIQRRKTTSRRIKR